MTGSKKHIHKYMRVQLKFAKVWRCSLPDCYHYMPPHMEEMLIGRKSICWSCGNHFPLDEIAMKEEMPNCFSCRSGATETTFGETTALSDYLAEKINSVK